MMLANYDKEVVRSAAHGRWPEILMAICGLTEEQLDPRRHQPCPRCGGTDRYRSFQDVNETGGLLCNQCGTHADGFAAIGWLCACDFPTAVGEVAEYLGLTAAQPDTIAADPLASIAAAKGVPANSLVAYGAVSLPVLKSIEFPAFGPDSAQCTTFRVWAEGSPIQKKGKFAARKKAGLFLPVTCGKPRLPAAGETWHLVEGLKDAAALHSLGLLACGLPTCRLNAKFGRLFTGVHIIIVPDRDDAGEKCTEQITALLHKQAASIRVAVLPAEFRPTNGADVRDVLRQPDGRELVLRAIADAQPATIADPSRDGTRGDRTPLTDVGNGERFARQHSESVRYVYAWNKWLTWDGTRWASEENGEPERLAKETARKIYLVTNAKGVGESEAKEIADWARRSESAERIRAMLAMARSEACMPITVADLNADPWLLNFANGTLDLRIGELREHRRADYITKVCEIEYPTEDGNDPIVWLTFLDRIFDGNADLIEFVQRLMGVSLVGEVQEHILPIFWGTGANGKSTILETWAGMLGKDYALKAPASFLMAKHGDSHPTELADLHGIRLVSAVETADGGRLSEALVKELTGGDTIRARRMRENFWQFKPSHTVVLTTNHKPTIRGTDLGIWRRICLVPFEVTIPDGERDATLPHKLQAEWPAIMRWAVAGCLAWQRDGLQRPHEVSAATADYRADSDVFGEFVESCCLVGRAYKVKSSILYNVYRQWADSHGERIVSQRMMGDRLAERGFRRFKSNGVSWWLGITDHDLKLCNVSGSAGSA